MMKKVIWTIICILIAGGVLTGALLLHSRQGKTVVVQQPDGWITFNKGRIAVDVADTEATREQGLSGRATLAENHGMLFFFDAPGRPGFWMKDMLFSIDIIWISKDWTVIDITKNLSPDTYPNAFSPAAEAQYVLEVPAGFADIHHIQIGQSLSFSK